MTSPLRVAVQMDPIESINIDGDSTFALMLEGQVAGPSIVALRGPSHGPEGGARARPEGKREDRLFARGHRVKVERTRGAHYAFDAMETLDLGTMDVVLMRQDPPFDMAYITATHMLEHIQPGTLVVNDPPLSEMLPKRSW